MRTILAFTLLITGICGSYVSEPLIKSGTVTSRDSRFISGNIEAQIVEAIGNMSKAMKDDGLDPLVFEKEEFAYELPVPVIFNAAGLREDILVTGLSNIVVEHINYSVVWFRLDLVLALPHLHLSTRVAKGDVTLFGNTLTAVADGRVEIRGTTVVAEIRVRVGLISGSVTITGVTIDFKLGRINSNIRLAIQGDNYSADINNFIANTIPAVLEENSAELNELIEIILFDILNENIN